MRNGAGSGGRHRPKPSRSRAVVAWDARMATEIEAKLAVSPRAMQRAARLPWLRKLARGAATRTIVSTYFDTPKLKLRRHGLTLRIRRIGRQRLQTIKAAGVGVSGREEHEHEVAGDTP